MFKKGDRVQLNALGTSAKGLGGEFYIPNSCARQLLNGEVMVVSYVYVQGKNYPRHSLFFDGSAFSFSAKFFELL